MSRSVLRVDLSGLNEVGRCAMRRTYRTFRRGDSTRTEARVLIYMMVHAIDHAADWTVGR